MGIFNATEFNQTLNLKMTIQGVRLWAIRSMVKRETAQTAK